MLFSFVRFSNLSASRSSPVWIQQQQKKKKTHTHKTARFYSAEFAILRRLKNIRYRCFPARTYAYFLVECKMWPLGSCCKRPSYHSFWQNGSEGEKNLEIKIPLYSQHDDDESWFNRRTNTAHSNLSTELSELGHFKDTESVWAYVIVSTVVDYLGKQKRTESVGNN